jgi:4-hydroxy-3-methylbut-2-enyl diphosphate reductase
VLARRPTSLACPRPPRYGLIAQTTQPIEHVRGLVAEIRRFARNPKCGSSDTVCKPTKDRQNALQSLLAEAEVIVVVGGRCEQ